MHHFWQDQLEEMEEGLERAQGTFAELDAQMSHASQTATKIGDRLHVSCRCKLSPVLDLCLQGIRIYYVNSPTLSIAGTKNLSFHQNAEGFRKRALEGIRVITYLQEFANISQLSELSELFQDDNRLAEAAVRSYFAPLRIATRGRPMPLTCYVDVEFICSLKFDMQGCDSDQPL
jgi:hypothetical protein